jgi:hypothetical protein
MGRGLVLLTKDVLRSDYLSCYNSEAVIRTPHIDQLAEEGIKFNNFYSSAPSTAMAVTCMFSGLNAYELERKSYRPVDQFTQASTLFNEFEKSGTQTFVIWPKEFENLAYVYSKVFDESTSIHYAPAGGAVWATPHNSGLKSPDNNYDLTQYIVDYLHSIQEKCQGNWFVWCHCPHIFFPCLSYGSDIAIFDDLVGRINREIEAEIILSGDHGHMGGHKGKLVYGFHLYEPAIKVPLIIPKWISSEPIDFPVGQNQLKDIILSKEICKQEYIFSDTKYYEQPGRVLMIRSGNFKYIYNKSDKSEELYDLKYDKSENINLLVDLWPDFDRNGSYLLDQVVHYPDWDSAHEKYLLLKREKDRVWRDGSMKMHVLHLLNEMKKAGLSSLIKKKPKPYVTKGRWGSRARINL